MRGRAVAIGVGSPQAPWPQPPSQPPEAGGRPHRNTCGCKLGAAAEGRDQSRAWMADSTILNGRTSDSRATSAIVCVSTTRLPLKMQAQPARSGLKDAPKWCKRRYLHGLAACDCGSHLSSQQRALGTRGTLAKRRPMQRYARQGAGRDRALGLQVQLGGKEGTTTRPMSVRPRILPRILQRQFFKCSHVYSPHNDKTRNTYRVTMSPDTSWSQRQGLVAFNWPCFVTKTCVARRQPPAMAGGSRLKG